MSKSILVIDTPKNCESCPFCRGWNVCKIMKYLKKEKNISIYTVDHQIFKGDKPDWCPLKELPGKKSFDAERVCGTLYEDILFSAFREVIALGWNACIDEILKKCD